MSSLQNSNLLAKRQSALRRAGTNSVVAPLQLTLSHHSSNSALQPRKSSKPENGSNLTSSRTHHRRLSSVSNLSPKQHQQCLLDPHSSSMSRRRSIFELVSPGPTAKTEEPEQVDASSNNVLDYAEIEDTSKNYEAWLKILETIPALEGPDSQTLEYLISQGIPKKLRGQVWDWLIRRELTLTGQRDEVPDISKREFDQFVSPERPSLWTHMIQLDVGRTFPGHAYFAKEGSHGQKALLNVLKAYSLVDPEVGYCQGISFIAGIVLMHCSSEYEAFQLLLALMFGFNYRTVFLPNMDGLHRCLYQLTRLLDTKMPAILELLIMNNAMPDLFASPWFVTLFSSTFPLAFVVRIFDLVFYGNLEMLFRVIFSFFALNEDVLMGIDGEIESAMHFFKTTLPAKSTSMLPQIFELVFNMDLSVDLDRYAVEYSVYREDQLNDENEEALTNQSATGSDRTSSTTTSLDDSVLNSSGSDAIEADCFSFEAVANEHANSSNNNNIRVLNKKLCAARAKVCDLAQQVEYLQAALIDRDRQIDVLRRELEQIKI